MRYSFLIIGMVALVDSGFAHADPVPVPLPAPVSLRQKPTILPAQKAIALPAYTPFRPPHLPWSVVRGVFPLRMTDALPPFMQDMPAAAHESATVTNAPVPLPMPTPFVPHSESSRPEVIVPADRTFVPLPVARPVSDQALGLPELSSATAPLSTDQSMMSCTAIVQSGLVRAELLPPQYKGRCTISDAMLLQAVRLPDNREIGIQPAAIIRCKTALSIANWVRNSVVSNAGKLLNTRIIALRNAASFDCRGRNRQAGAKLSEHGYGHALDISAFQLENGEWFEVRAPGRYQSYFNTVRADSCGPFTTVLGPGSDRFHSDHLHLDIAERSKRGRSKGLVCR